MRGFAKLVAAPPKKPATIVTVPVEAFAETWKDRPTTPIQVGIKTICEKRLHEARSQAARTSFALHPEEHEREDRLSAYNDALMAVCVGECTTHPDDIEDPFFGLMAEDKARVVLTSEGLKFLWQALERACVGQSPIAPEASDADITRLAAIAPEALARMSEGRSRPLRRLIAHVLSQLEI